MKKLPLIFVMIFSFLFLFLSYVPNIYEASLTDTLIPNRVMIWGEHVYTYDYNVYLSKIRQGQEDRWSVVDKYDNHPEQKGIFLQMLYLLGGKAAGIFHLTPVLTFHLLRTVFSVVWVLTIIFINIYFLRQPVFFIMGVVLSFLAASFPAFYQFEGTTWVGSYMNWWQELDLLKHVSYVPHYMVGYIGIGLFTLLLHLFEQNKKYFIFICLMVFFLMFIQPSGALLIVISWFLYFLIKIFWRWKVKMLNFFRTWDVCPEYSGQGDPLEDKNLVSNFPWLYSIILIIAAFIPLLYIQQVTAAYPWKTLMDFEQQYHYLFNLKEYILALGPLFFTGVAGTVLVLIKKNRRLLPIATWIMAAFAGILIFSFFPFQSPMRFVQTANHIPLAILSAYFLFFLWRKNIFIKIITVIIVITVILNGIVQTYFSLKRQTQFINQRASASLPLVPYPPQVMYPLADFYYGIKWLEKNTHTQAVVLSKITAGNYIPAYAGNFVYYGHVPESPHFSKREQMVNWFFSGQEDEQEALGFLKKETIAYVFYGPQEKDSVVKDIARYAFLKPVYQTQLVTIFQVKK